jgi:hypothetical protein
LRSSKIVKLKEKEQLGAVPADGFNRSKKSKLSQLRKLLEIFKAMILMKS